MRFWLLHSGEVPIQDQIVAQVSLGVLSGELAPGERLPSVRELARRFHIHANTVSLAYRRLEKEQWLESRRGSGMYVRASAPAPSAPTTPGQILGEMVVSLVATARRLGLSEDALRRALDQALADPGPASYLLIEPDPSLQQIVLAELAATLPGGLRACRLEELPLLTPGTVALVLPSKAAAVRAALPPETRMHILRVRSVPQSLAAWLPAPTAALVGIASGWAPFLDFARTMLVAAGFDADALLLRNTTEKSWHQGLAETDAVVCDTHTATLLPAGIKTIPFRLLADDALTDL